MKNIFKNCKNLEEMPNISHWYNIKGNDIQGMLDGCDNLKKINNEVNWMNWEGRNIVIEIMKRKKIPDEKIIEKLKKDVKNLIGGANTVYFFLCNNWRAECKDNYYIYDELSRLAEQIFIKLN